MRPSLALVSCALGVLASRAVGGEDGPTLAYELTVLAPERVVLVGARLDSLPEDGGDVLLRWAEGYAFARLPGPLLEGEIQADVEGVSLAVERLDGHTWRVERGGATHLRLAWTVPIRHREEPLVRAANDGYEFPYLEDDHGLLVTATLLAAPFVDERVPPATVRFVLPAGWRVRTPWPELEPGVFAPGKGLRNDLVAVGAWDVRVIALEGFEAKVAVAPGQGDLLDLVGEPIARIVAHELRIFGRAPRERYLFLFGRSDLEGFGGSPKTGSMTLAVGANARAVAGRHVPHLVAHEFFHTWAQATARMADELRWMNEGVTDWYAYLVQARVGLMEWDELARTLGQKVASWVDNPLAGETSLVAAGGPVFFEGGDAYRLVYDGGLVVGAWLDRALRARHGVSLDRVLRAFLDDAERFEGPDPEATLAGFLECVAEHADEDLAAELASLVRSASVPDPRALFAGVGVALADRGPEASPRFVMDPARWRTHRADATREGGEGGGAR